ncbi:uncharacterized protein ACNFOS_007605 [Eudromia elegans]
MERQRRQRRSVGARAVLLCAWLLCWGCRAAAERLRYAIAEETGSGSVVGPLARDLGLSPAELPARQLRISSEERYFSVSADSGELYVSERLDREEMCGDSASCSVSFEAVVQNPLNVFQIDVDIQDINDNAPVFSKAALDLEIGEWILPGSRFPLEMAHDPDVGSNSLISYELTENPSFRLEVKESGDGSRQPELVLEAALDREKQSSFEMVLTAVDGGSPSRSGTVQLRINVTDANDNAPVFSKSAYEARVRENVATGSLVLQVRATDADAGSNGRVSYSFSNVPDAVRAVFSIDSDSGDIRNVGTLDFEERKEYTFGVTARDGAGMSSHCKVHIEITDENDNAPEITVLSVSSSVPEDSPAGTVVALLKVRDRDSGENGQVWCELEGDSPLSIVASSGSSYKVVTASALDRERASEHNVTVVASDRGMPSLRSRTALSLSVSDVNDNAPVFEEAAYSAYVWENNAAGASVLRVRARDADAGANGRVSYWLVGVSAGSASSAAAAPSVSVEARSGALYAQRSLDYEQCREFAVQVRAQDGGSPARSSTATVRVFVLDLNDNAPQVLWPAASVSGSSSVASGPFEVVPRSAEAGYVVSKVVAVDADSGRNAWLSYELVQATEPSLFRVSLQSGEVRTARSVSERDASRQRLVVLVKDHGEPSLSATATLHVVLAESLQEALPALSERASGAEAPWDLQFYLVLALALLCALLVLSVALAVAARLRGAGPPAVLRCLRAERLSAAGAAFPADFCEGTLPYSYNLCVAPGRALAECALLPAPLPSRAVDDLLGGDPPAALPPSSSRAPPEPPSDSDALQSIHQIADQENCRFESSPREVHDRCHKKWLEYLDSQSWSGARRAAAAPPAVSRLDPWRAQGAGSSVPAAVGGPALWCGRGPCGSGAVQAEERRRRRVLLGRAMSGAAGRALLWCALVWAWELSRGQLRYSVPEEMQKGSFVGDVAKDLGLQLSALRDRGARVVSEGRRQYFSLHEKTGHLVTAERIDREQVCRVVEECVLRCELLVEGEMKVYAIEVEVRDINDNAPAFKEVEVEEIMSEITAPGSHFPLAEAHDPDIGSNSLQRYELSGDEHFSLAVQTVSEAEKRPELVLEKPLDREEAAFYELVLTAVDGGDPARTGTARIRVVVLDANDNAPVFSQAVYTVRVREDVPVGSVLLTVTANDADDGMNGEVKYSLKKSTDITSEILDLDMKTGVITLVKNLDFEEGETYEIEVQAKDGGGLSDTAKVTITVTDVNDNAPEISVRSLLSAVPEDCPPGTVVALLHVQDRDSGANGEVRCSLGAGLPFRLRSSLGSYYSVETSRELDREAVSEYNVTVRATDGGSPSLWSSAVLPLRVLDVNDNAPVFAEARYSARVSENNAAGALVLRVRAWDADWGENARVRYGLCEGQVRGAPLSSYVSVHAETGALYALRSFDYEEVREVGLWVRAEDGGAPALSSNVSVRLEIVDENDNAPQVLYPAPSSSSSWWSGVELSPRSAEPGTLVAKVVAVDADSGQNAWLSYEVVKATDAGLFRVGVHSGEVRTARLAVSRDALRQSLVVLVKDHGEPALSATATLTLVLAESVAELLWEAGGAAAPGGGEDEDDSGVMVTRWLVVAVSGVGCLLVALLVLLVSVRVREWRRCRELGAGSGSVRAVPASQFVGIEGVRAFLHSYAHDVSLSGDWRKRQLGCPGGSCCNTLPAAPPPDKGAPLLLPEEPSSARGDADSGDALLGKASTLTEDPFKGICCSLKSVKLQFRSEASKQVIFQRKRVPNWHQFHPVLTLGVQWESY